ncbi:hypothetical protein FHR92_003960 [Fontibacillus solani]|uniref:Uncharacterized protein n=1 Tax=Fontibacillus solani TaxID=1572857 RepID=A0A7W3SWK8_9BACL|nr:hypothetical protein [Fontibacillus solani]MBA9087475.1 hypothetical protein [Fontibacillus solani]
MINKIVDAISVSLNEAFGDDYEIYTESVEQGLQEPCFSISCLNPTNNLFRNKKYFRTNLFCIQYFPKSIEPKAECNAVLERLYDCLELITIVENETTSSLTRGTRMKGEVVNGVLSFFVNYNMFVYKVEVPADEMESLEVKSDIRG